MEGGAPGPTSSAASRPDAFKSDLTTELRRPSKPEKPAKPESLERRASSHEQHQELIARHKNWFQSFSKSRASPASSPSKAPDARPTSPSKAEWAPRPTSPSKEGRTHLPSKTELRSPRGADTSEEETPKEKDKEKEKESEERCSKGGQSEQDAWSSVLQSRYGPKAKDILSPRARAEGETGADWRRERAAILSGRTGQRRNDSEDEGKGPPKGLETRFEDAATLQSGWSPPQHYGHESQPAGGAKTLKEEINVAETERAKSSRLPVRENGSAHDDGRGETVESIVALEKKKEKADLIVSESVVLKDSAKEKDLEKKSEATSYYASVSSSASVVSATRMEELRGGKKSWAQSKETTEEVNIKLKESISSSATSSVVAAAAAPPTVAADVPAKRDFLKEFEERRERRRQQREAEEEEERARIARREESRRKREEASEMRRKEELENRKREEARREEARRLRQERREKSEERFRERGDEVRREGERGRSKERRDGERERSKERQEEERLSEGERSKELRREFRPRERSEESRERQRERQRERREERAARESSEEKARSPRRERERAKEERDELPKEEKQEPVEGEEEEEAKKEVEEPNETQAAEIPKVEVEEAPISAPEVAVAEEGKDVEEEEKEEEVQEMVLVGEVLSALKAETVYVSSSEDVSHDLSVHEDPKADLSLAEDPKSDIPLTEDPKTDLAPDDDSAREVDVIPQVRVVISEASVEYQEEEEEVEEEEKEEEPRGVQEEPDEVVVAQEEEEEEKEEKKKKEQEEEKDPVAGAEEAKEAPLALELESPEGVQVFPDVIAECDAREDLPLRRAEFRPRWADPGATSPDEAILVAAVATEAEVKPREEEEEVVETSDATSPPLSPRTQSLAALDALIHGGRTQTAPASPPTVEEPPLATQEEEEEILYDHTVTSAQHKLQFCTTPVTVEGIAPDSESHGTDPEPLPPPIPPHGIDPGTIAGVDLAQAGVPLMDPEVMTPEEAQRLLSAKEGQTLLSDEEAQEVVLLLSPQEKNAPEGPPPVPPHYSDVPSMVPPHYADITPPVPPHYAPVEDEYDVKLASHFDPTLTSPLSPEEEPSEADSSEASADVSQVSRAKEVLVEDGIHYLEDGHFWVEVPGLPEEDEEDELDPTLPFHQHTRLTFSKDPIQVFSTYSVMEYDRKNDEVDPVAASAEYELEKRVEKMDVFPVEIVKGEGGLGLSIIGMGVGADAGVEKLGIFVKTITPGGATERDGRIQVNDQIIEVDGKSLVGVTQVFAASVLKNTSGRVHFLIGREKDPENSEVALLIKQSLQADLEREERRRALGGPDYDPHANHGLFDPLSSPSDENSRSEDMSMHHNNYSYIEGGSSPTSPEAVSPPAEVFDLEGDTSDTSPDNDVAMLKLKLKEVQYRNAIAEAEVQKLKMRLLDMEKILDENNQYSSQLREARNQMSELEEKLQSKTTEVSTYQDMLEQSQGQYIVLEKKYYKAKKIIKEYQGRERDFLHREEYHITQLEDKDSHYNALVKALKDRVINLEAELTNAQKMAGLPVQVPADASMQPPYWQSQQSAQSAKQPPRKPSLCTLDPEISDTETSDTGNSEGDKANTVERKMPVKEELDQAVPPHELLDVSASRAKGELAARGGLANRHLPSLKKTTSMSSAGSQDQSLDDSSLDDDLPESQKHMAMEPVQDLQQDAGTRRSADILESPLPPPQSVLPPSSVSKTTKTPPPPPPYSHLGSPPPYQHPPGQFSSNRQPLAPSHVLSDPPSSLPVRPLGTGMDVQPHHETQSESRPEIPYRHPPPVARVLPVNRAEISESSSLASHIANRTPQQQSLAEQLKALLAERDLQSDVVQQRNERDLTPNKRSPTSLMEDVRQAVLQADVSSHVVPTGQMVHPLGSPQRTQPTIHYSASGRESLRDSSAGSGSPKLGRSSIHSSSVSSVCSSPPGVVLLSQRPLDSSQSTHRTVTGVDGSSGDLSSGPASLGSGDEGSGASLGSQSSLSLSHPPTERSKRSHMWQTTPVVDWSKEQVNQWLIVQGLEGCVGRFQEIGITGPRLLNLDVRDLKSLGLAPDDKSKLKRKVKELRIAVEKERKQVEKEKKEREKLQKKAEKLAEKAEKKKK